MASARGTRFGKTLRAAEVASANCGVRTMQHNDSGQCRRAAKAEPSESWQLAVSPPSRAAATLSGCPSRWHAALSSPCEGNGLMIASYRRSPATVAAALLPRPPFIGMSLMTLTDMEGNEPPCCTARKRKARSM